MLRMTTFDFSDFTDEAFAAYLAGFTDGEGYIGIEPTTRKGVSVVRIILANCVPEVLRGIQARLGYGAIRSQQFKPHWRERFTLSVTNMRDCESFLRTTLPYLHILHIKHGVALDALKRIEEARTKQAAKAKRNDAIRAAAQSGERRKDIAVRFNLSPQAISRICEGHRWPSEQSRVAKLRKRDERGLFAPIKHSPSP